MRYTVCPAALALLASCYLAPEKHSPDRDPLTEESGAANADGGASFSADAAVPGASCMSADACSSAAPRCADGACAPCTEHAHCTRFAGAPACGPQGTCVSCTADELRACTTTAPACDSISNQCVQCGADPDCRDARRSACNSTSHTCEPCANSDDCAHVPGKNVCHEGSCVECTRGNITACSGNVLGGAAVQFVCNPVSLACDRTRAARSKQVCEACISDLECSSGSVCVDVPAGAGQRVCQQLRSSAGCVRPYAGGSTQPIVTADGELAAVCTFAVDTTCDAHRHYRNQRCGTPVQPGASQDIEGSGNNARCGALGRDDGFCVWNALLRQHLCTVPCNNNVVDCPVDAVSCALQVHASPMSRNLCSL